MEGRVFSCGRCVMLRSREFERLETWTFSLNLNEISHGI